MNHSYYRIYSLLVITILRLDVGISVLLEKENGREQRMHRLSVSTDLQPFPLSAMDLL